MSLVRVQEVDQYERDGTGKNVTKNRRMSFNPVVDYFPPRDRKESLLVIPEEPKEIPKRTRLIQVILAVISCLLAAGIVFGYAAIKPVLIYEGVFDELCTPQEISEGTSPCYKQEIRLNLMFTIAAVLTNVAALPIGTILDRYGPRACGIIGSVFLLIGAILFSSAHMTTADLFTPGYGFLAVGGPFVYISSYQLSNSFPQNSGLILALLVGAFDSSSALFLIFRLLHEATDGAFTTRKFFLVYLVVPVFILVSQITVMPKVSYESVSQVIQGLEEDLEEVSTPFEAPEAVRQQYRERRQSTIEIIDDLMDRHAEVEESKKDEAQKSKSGVWGVMHGFTAPQQIKSPWFWLITCFTVIQMTRINYFVATIRPQERYLLGSDKNAKLVNDIFDLALPLGGVIAIPFVGMILDNTSTAFALGTLLSMATVMGVLGCLESTGAAIANVCIFVVHRPFFYTAISDYCAKVFGFQTFGKVYGLLICLAGIFNFLQSPLDALTHVAFDSNPTPVNAALLAVSVVVGILLVTFIYIKSKNIAKIHAEEGTPEESQSLFPGSNNVSYGS